MIMPFSRKVTNGYVFICLCVSVSPFHLSFHLLSDVTSFSPTDEEATRLSVAAADQLRQQGKFVDVSKFTLKCMICQKGLTGQEDAVAHAKETSHQNFCEYK